MCHSDVLDCKCTARPADLPRASYAQVGLSLASLVRQLSVPQPPRPPRSCRDLDPPKSAAAQTAVLQMTKLRRAHYFFVRTHEGVPKVTLAGRRRRMARQCKERFFGNKQTLSHGLAGSEQDVVSCHVGSKRRKASCNIQLLRLYAVHDASKLQVMATVKAASFAFYGLQSR